MRQRLWADLLETPQDLDYVERFQNLAALNLEMRRAGPTASLLVRKSILETGVGNHAAALQAAEDALVVDADDAEAQFQLGRACLLMALVRAGLVPQTGETGPMLGATELVQKAATGYRAAARLNEGDEESAHDATFLENLLAANGTEETLIDALYGEAGVRRNDKA